MNPAPTLDQRATWLIGILNAALDVATADLAAARTERPADLRDPLLILGLPPARHEHLYGLVIRESGRAAHAGGKPSERGEGGEADRESVLGLPQIEADVTAHKLIAALIGELEPNAVVVGEEASGDAWDEWAAAEPGTIIYSVDSIDGSAPYDSLSFGYSSNLLMYVRQPDRTDALVMSIVVNSSRLVLVYQVPNRVTVSYANTIQRTPLDEPVVAPDDVRAGFTAVVGAQPAARRRAAVLLDTTRSWGLPTLRYGGVDHHDPPLTVFTTGGAPVTLGLALGKLDAIVFTQHQTIHDAAGVPALLALGLKAHGRSGPIESRALLEEFNLLDRPNSAGYKPIEPLVICRDESLGRLMAERLWSDGKLDLVAKRRRSG